VEVHPRHMTFSSVSHLAVRERDSLWGSHYMSRSELETAGETCRRESSEVFAQLSTQVAERFLHSLNRAS
jgi:hypothetical protein